jgi:hypothetical protein
MKIVFYAPHAGIWVHAFPEALVAEALAQSGHQIVYVTCDRQFSGYCTPMTADRLRYDSPAKAKEATCRRCEGAAATIGRSFGFRHTVLGRYLREGDAVEIERIQDGTTRENFLDLYLEGVPVGRLATYELLLNRKKRSLDFSDDEWTEYRILLGNALRSLMASRRMLDEESPDRVVVYNSLYAVNNVACRLAEARGIPTYFLHAGGNLSHRMETLLIGRKDGVRFYERLLDYWPSVRELPCDSTSLSPVTDHFLELLRGTHAYAYSAPKASRKRDLVREFGIPPASKVLVATMSSPDERFAANVIEIMGDGTSRVFLNQVEWIGALCEWLRSRSDLFLIIRVHPREFPNKRERVTSEHALELAKVLNDVPPNVRVNWPDDQVSLYDLAGVADVFLNAWSAAGKEMSLLGLPVVVYAPELLVYPPDLNYAARTREEYFPMIDRALGDGWSAERMRIAFRWCALEYEKAVIDIKESFPRNVSRLRGRAASLLDRLAMRTIPGAWKTMDCRGRAPNLRAAGTINTVLVQGLDTPLEIIGPAAAYVSLDEETTAIREQARRLVRALYGNSRNSKPVDPLHRNLTRFSLET